LLRKELDRLGVFTLQRGYYVRKLSVSCSLFAVTIPCVFVPKQWVVFSAACVLAFAGTQLGFLGHDFGHHQVFRNPGKNDAFGLLIMNLLLGFSYGWWKRKHDEHHANPNHL
jgi:fatty acid desaturase